ncbi:MAG: prepilin-type N-terminal cleavage/methylation domain-containing protein [Rubrivivax sp.]|nr:prepilin-type N-terminal cleavage/methylation domain-containing protein [Rubrivivax sp.]
MPMMMRPRSGARGFGPQRGMSLVELMVGITVGLFVVAAASTLAVNQLSDNRKLLVETQIQQDLRATMDIITRQLRRAGAVDIGRAQSGLALGATGGAKSDFTDVDLVGTDDVGFTYYRNAAEAGPYGFKLDGNVIKTRLAGGGWQELTDANVLKITSFTITADRYPDPASALRVEVLPCPKPCADGTANCWPQLVVRNYTVAITAEATGDPAIQRSISSRVRLRNDWLSFNDPASPTLACPA